MTTMRTAAAAAEGASEDDLASPPETSSSPPSSFDAASTVTSTVPAEAALRWKFCDFVEPKETLYPSTEFGEHSKLKVICARDALLLGMKTDRDHAIRIGRKVRRPADRPGFPHDDGRTLPCS